MTTRQIDKTDGQIVSENVIFDPIAEVSVSRASWKISYVLEMNVYDQLYRDYNQYIKDVSDISFEVMNRYLDLRNGSKYAMPFSTLSFQVQHLNQSKERFFESYNSYKALHSRKKRALIPFIGDIGNFLFGWSTDEQIDGVKTAVKTLSDNQEKLTHVVEQSLTIINKTREDVRINRDRIGIMNIGIAKLKREISDWANKAMTEFNIIRQYLYMYIQLKGVIDSAQEILFETVQYFNTLKSQMDMLASGQVTPSTIQPENLRTLLREIDRKLPSSLQLPVDPEKNLWLFYRLMTAKTVFDDDRMLMIIDIPLVNFLQRLQIYKIYNLPIAHPEMYINDTSPKTSKHITALYEVETNVIGIDTSRSNYVLLHKEEAKACIESNSKFCQITSPTYPINVNKFCVMALFTGKNVKDLCKAKVRPNSILPMAEHIKNGLWLVSTAVPLEFRITCDNQGILKGRNARVMPPIGLINLNQSCIATSDAITLPRYYEFESTQTSRERFKINKRNFTIWEPLEQVAKPKFGGDWDLPNLEDVEEIDMSNLVKTVRSIKRVKMESNWKTSYTIAIIVGILVVLGVLGFVGYQYSQWLPRPSKSRRGSDASSKNPEPEMIPLQELPPTMTPKREEVVKEVSPLESPVESVPSYKLYPRV